MLITQNDKCIIHAHIPFSNEEAQAFKNYCNENGIIMAQLIRRLIINELKTKSTILAVDYTAPKINESLNKSRRK